MKNYADMTDTEINFAVARIVSTDGVVERNDLGNVVLIHDYHNGICLGWKSVDYCNNWADSGPVIFENKVTIFSPNDTHDDSLWMAELGEFHFFNVNPLRAAMIVFLMMKDNETRILAPDEVSDE